MQVGFIDYYLDEWHANNYPRMLKALTGGEVEVAYAYGQIPSPITGKTSRTWCQEKGIALCETIEEVVEKSDVLIVLSPDNCEMHEALSRIPLKSGKRTYIDKTFTPDQAAARRIFALAEEHGTPCYSTSALRFATEYRDLLGQDIRAISTVGPYDMETYGIHQLEPIMMLMGGRVRRALALGQGKWAQVTLEWADGRCAALLCTGNGNTPFSATVQAGEKSVSLQVTSDSFAGFMESLVRFFRTGEIPVSHEETTAIMAAREAAIRALAVPGHWVEA